MTEQEIAELESRINQTIENFKKDHRVTTSDVNGILSTLVVTRTAMRLIEMLEEKKDEQLVQPMGVSPVFKET